MQHAVLLGRGSWMHFYNRCYRSLPPRPSDHLIVSELELSDHALAGVWGYAIDPVTSDGGFHLSYHGAEGVTLPDEPQSARFAAKDLTRSLGTVWSTCSPSLTCPQWRNNLSTLDTRSFPSLGWRISSLAISTQWPTLRSCAFRWTPCSTTADLPAFIWPTSGGPDLCRCGITSHSCGRYGLALACPDRDSAIRACASRNDFRHICAWLYLTFTTLPGPH